MEKPVNSFSDHVYLHVQNVCMGTDVAAALVDCLLRGVSCDDIPS